MKKIFYILLFVNSILIEIQASSFMPIVEEYEGERYYILKRTHDLPPFENFDQLSRFTTYSIEDIETFRLITKCPDSRAKTNLMKQAMDIFLTFYDACNEKVSLMRERPREEDIRLLHHFILNWLIEMQDLRVPFVNGFSGFYNSPFSIRKKCPEAHRGDLIVIYYIRRQAKHKVTDIVNMIQFPEVFLSYREEKGCPAYWHQEDWLNATDPSKPRVMMCTQKGVVEENVLWVEKRTDNYSIKMISGTRHETPFTILNQTTVSATSSLLNELKLNDGHNYFPLPETNADLDVLELLLLQYKINEEKIADLNIKVEVLTDVEDDNDDALATAQEDLKLTKEQEHAIKREAKRALRREEKERLAKKKEDERKQHILNLENEAIQGLAEEIIARQDYDLRVQREQEGIAGRFDRDTKHQKPQDKKSFTRSAPALEETHEQNNARWEKALEQARGELQGRRAKMNQVAKVLNQIFKIFPDMRHKLLPPSSERQKGSHRVLPGGAAASNGNYQGPTTFVIPHGRRDLTMPTQRAQNFIEAFSAFCHSNNSTEQNNPFRSTK
ncbi:MAG: hypothetical protein HEEMFOPI_01792 [Holosporales bacterium]